MYLASLQSLLPSTSNPPRLSQVRPGFRTKRHAFLGILALALLLSSGASAQLVGTKNIPGDYPTLAAAITDLNTQGVGAGGVTLNLISGNPETAPVGGYAITATGTATDNVIIQGNSNTITAGLQAAAGSAAAASFDAVFKIVGGDFITIQGFTMQENAGNTVLTAGATNTMTEFGVLLIHASATDGCQNDTIQNNIISLNTAYTNSVGIFSTSSSAGLAPFGALDATSTAGTNSNNKIYGNTITNVAQGIVFICPPITATIFETGNDIGGSSAGTANTITFGNATATSGPWNRSQSTVQAGIYYRNGAGNSIRFNSVTATSAAYVGSSGLNGIMISSGTAPTGVTYTSTISDNTVNLTSTGIALLTGIDFGHGISTGTIVGNNNNVTVNQTSSAANAAAALGIKANYTSATNTANGNTVIMNQSSSAGALSGTTTGVTLAGTATTTITANSNNITLNATSSGTGTITGAETALSVAGASTINTVNSNTILFNQTTSVATGITTGSLTGIVATSAASTSLNIGSTNQITVKQGVTGAGTYGTNAVAYLSVNAAHNNVNITNNTFNTTGSTVRSTGALDVILGGSSTLTGTLTITGNTANIDRVSASGAVGFYTQTSTSPNDPTDNISNNNITFTNLAGTSSATVINRLGGGTTATRTVSGNTISVSGSNTGSVAGIISGFCGTATMAGNSVTVSSAGATVTGITANSNTTAAAISNSTLSLTSSATSPTSMTGISVAGSGGHSVTSTNFSAMNFTGIITTTPTVSGIVASGGTSANIFGNTITNISVGAATSTSSATVDGLLISGGTSINAFKNKIHGLTTAAAGTATIVSGVRVSAGTANAVFNNLIGNLTAPASASLDSIRGINVTSATSTSANNISFNTVFLNASSTGTNFGTTGVFHTTSTTATTATLNLRNNVVVNTSTPAGTGLTVAYRRSSGAANALANYSSNSNNNDFFAGTPGASNLIYSDGTSSAQTMSAYKSGAFTAGTISPRDTASFSENPPFLSTTGANANFLHINPTIATQLESGAVPIAGITDDFDADTRNGSTPDVGADEFAGILADFSGPSISYALLSNTLASGSRSFPNVTIVDPSGVNTTAGTKPRVYYKRGTDGNVFNDNTSATDGWKFAEANGATSPFDFTIDYSLLSGGTGIMAGQTVQYFVVAQDLAATPNVAINTGTFAAAPSSVALTAAAFPIGGSINSYSILSTISGSKTVGAGGDYPTLTAAINALNTSVLNGPLNFILTDAAYPTETFPIIINANSGSDSTNKVTIKPSIGVSPTITGSSASCIVNLNGADWVIIDGSNAVGGTSRDLTIANSNTGTTSAVVCLTSLGAGQGATNDTVKNTNLVGNAPTTTFAGVISGNSTISTSTLGADNHNNTIQNNNISKVQIGIVSQGASAAAKSSGTVITQNVINTASTNNVSKGGIYVGFENNIAITQNIISNISGSSSYAWGISLGLTSISSTNTTGNEVTNATISRNLIGSIRSSSTFGVGGIQVAPATSGTTQITNNMISDANTNGTTGDIGAGIYVGGATGSVTQVYFNSVTMGGTFTGGADPSFGIAINGTNPVVDLRNNILTSTGSTGANLNRAIGLAYSTFTNLTSDYNDLLVSGTGAAIGQTGTLANTGFTTSTTLANWQTNTTKDTNSKNVDPVFVSATDLHLQGASTLLGMGVAGTGVTIDIDADPRDNPPDIGADEIPTIIAPGVLQFSSTNYAGSEGTTATITVTRTAGTTGSVTVDYATSNGVGAVGAGACGGGGDYVSASGTLTFGDTVSSQTFMVPLCSDAVSDPGETVILTLSNATGGASFGANNPATLTITDVPPPLSGSYNVPGDFASLTNTGGIFDRLNTSSASGNVTINIAADLAGETGNVALNQLPVGITVTIKPTGVARTITGSSAAALIKLNDADNVTIDGSLSGGTDRSLSMTNTNTGGSTAAIWVASATNGAQNNTIKNLNISGGVDQSVTSTFNFGIVSSSSAAITTGGADNDNNTYTNNFIKKVGVGILSIGALSTNMNESTTISNNLIGPAAFGIDEVSLAGVLIFNENAAGIVGNEIRFIGDASTASGSSGRDHVGIALGTTSAAWSATTAFTSVAVTNANVSRNLIHDIVERGTFSAVGIVENASNGANPTANTIANNMIYNIQANGTLGDQTVGIGLANGNGDKVVFNSVYLTGDIDPGASSTATVSGAGLYAWSTPTNLTCKDNVLSVDLTSNTSTLKHFAFVKASATYNFGSGGLDYNDYFVNSANTQAVLFGNGTSTPTSVTTLAAWQGETPAHDANSKVAEPNFVSATNLHVQAPTSVESSGTDIASVTDDFDGQTRSGLTPVDIGADAGNFKATPAFSNLTSSQSITYGTPSVVLAGKLSVGGSFYPAAGETITVTINGNAQNTTINDATGDFSISYNSSTLPANVTPYTITYSYGGNNPLNPATDTSTTLTVNTRALTIAGLTGTSKVYDGNATASFSGTPMLVGVVNMDDVTLSGTPSASFDNKNVGTNKPITVSGYTLSGTSASNYTLTQPILSGDITAKGINVTADQQVKPKGASDPTLTFSSDPLFSGDSFSGALARAAGETPGTYAITQGTLSAGTNYTISFTGANLVITGPIAGNDTASRATNSANIEIPLAALLANDTRIAANGSTQTSSLSVTAVTPGAGNTVAIAGANVLYTPTDPSMSAPLNFTYTLTDAVSGTTDTGTVTVNTLAQAPFALQITGRTAAVYSAGTDTTSVTVQFSAAPNQSYAIDYSTDMSLWIPYTGNPVSTGPTGAFGVTFTASGDMTAAWNAGMFFRATD